MFIFHIRSPFCPTSAESESLFWKIHYSIQSNFDNEEFPPTSPLSFPASRARNIFCDDVMLKYLPCHINDSTLSRASVPFGVFEERKSQRTAIRADTRAMPSDSCNSEECWYLILQRVRERAGEWEMMSGEEENRSRGGKKIKSPLENVPIITEALQQLSWPKIDWIESSLGILWRELLATRGVWRTFLQILLCLFWQFWQTRNISVSFQTSPEILGVIKGDGLASHPDESVMGWERGLHVLLKVMASFL